MNLNLFNGTGGFKGASNFVSVELVVFVTDMCLFGIGKK